MRRTGQRGLSRTQAGMLLIVAVVLISYFGFTKAIPFRHHFAIKADFKTSNNLRTNSLVRIAGVNVGKVTAIERISNTTPGVRVTLRIDKSGRPIHKDATVSLRPRIFLEGNLFVDLHPGTPTKPVLGDGDVIPATNTGTPVQLDQVLTTLQADTRADLVRLLAELSTSLSGKGGIGYNKSVQYWEPAFKNSAIVNDATLGVEPHDLSRYLAAQGRFTGALDRNPPALKALISDFNTTAAAFASEQGALRQTITELPRTLKAARPALTALNSSFPPLRRLVVDLRPATRSTGPMIDASLPFITQARLLVAHRELQGLTAALAELTPDLARLNDRLPDLYQQVRLASSCQNEVILPWSRDHVGDPVAKMYPAFKPQGKVFQEGVKNLPGLAEESRAGDANGQWARVIAGNGVFTYALTGLALNGVPRFGLTNFPLDGVVPGKSPQPPIRYDVPCETQEKPNLDVLLNPPPIRLFPDFLPPLPFASLAGAQQMEGVADLLEARGNRSEAKKMRAGALDLRRKYHLEGKKIDVVKGALRIVDDKNTNETEHGGKNKPGKKDAGAATGLGEAGISGEANAKEGGTP